MKKRHGTFFGIAVLLIMAIFTVVGCDNGTTTNNNNNNNNNGNPLITGKFESQTGTGDAVFYADYVSAGRSVGRSISRAVDGMSATEKELTGKIEDGDIIFNLKGVYDTATEKFFLSAGSSFLIFEIAGTLSDNGTMSETEAIVKTENEGNWTIQNVSVTSADDTAIDGNASDEQVDGLPSSWLGAWKWTDPEGSIGTYMLTPYQFTMVDEPDAPVGLMDITGTGSSRTMIWSVVSIYITEHSDGTIERELGPTNFAKVTVEENGSGLVFKLYGDGGIYGTPYFSTFAEAQAQLTTGDPAITETMTR